MTDSTVTQVSESVLDHIEDELKKIESWGEAEIEKIEAFFHLKRQQAASATPATDAEVVSATVAATTASTVPTTAPAASTAPAADSVAAATPDATAATPAAASAATQTPSA